MAPTFEENEQKSAKCWYDGGEIEGNSKGAVCKMSNASKMLQLFLENFLNKKSILKHLL